MMRQPAARFEHATVAISFPKQVVGHAGEIPIARDDAVACLDGAAEPDADCRDGDDDDLELERVLLHAEQRNQYDQAAVEQENRDHGRAQAVVERDAGQRQQEQQGDERELAVDVVRPGDAEDQRQGDYDDQDRLQVGRR